MPPRKKSEDLELDLKHFVRDRYPFWSCPYEPGLGSSNGYPDLQLMEDRSKWLLPVELKVGAMKNGRIFPREVRPAQIVWHYQFHRAGGRACILTGVLLDDSWQCFVVPGHWAEYWRQGFDIAECFFVDPANAVRGLCQMVDIFVEPEPYQRLFTPPT